MSPVPDQPFEQPDGTVSAVLANFGLLLATLGQHILAIEARQRAYAQHDPGCVHWPHPWETSIAFRNECSCWLSEPANTEGSS